MPGFGEVPFKDPVRPSVLFDDMAGRLRTADRAPFAGKPEAANAGRARVLETGPSTPCPALETMATVTRMAEIGPLMPGGK
jgi:hypothetical protein